MDSSLVPMKASDVLSAANERITEYQLLIRNNKLKWYAKAQSFTKLIWFGLRGSRPLTPEEIDLRYVSDDGGMFSGSPKWNCEYKYSYSLKVLKDYTEVAENSVLLNTASSLIYLDVEDYHLIFTKIDVSEKL